MHDETLTLPMHEHLQLHASQYKHTAITYLTQIYSNTPRLKNTIFNNGRYTTNIPTYPHSHPKTYNKHANEITHFELLDCIIKVNKLSTRVVVVYRPPPLCKTGLRYEDLAVEWASYIEQFVEVQEELLIVGRFQHSR